MDPQASGSRLRANAPEGQKRFPTSKSDFLSISRLHRAHAALRQQLREKAGAGIREGVPVPGGSAAIGWSPESGASNRQILRASRAAPFADAWPLRPRRAGRPLPESSCYRNRSARWTWQVGLIPERGEVKYLLTSLRRCE